MDTWIRVAALDALPPGTHQRIVAGGRELVLFNVGGEVHATTSACSHRGGPLADGALDAATITCPWHGWRFDVATGRCLEPGTRPPLETFPTRVTGGEVFVRVG